METFRRFIGVSIGAAIAFGSSSASPVAWASPEPVTKVTDSSPAQTQPLTSQTGQKTECSSSSAACNSAQSASPQPPRQAQASPNAPLYPSPQPSTPYPETLEPSANPLLRPSQPQEVQILGTQPLTLAEAIELARKNNPDLQSTRLELERAQAQLREARSALYPTVNFQTSVQRQQSASGQISAANIPAGVEGVANPDSPSTNLSVDLQVNYDVYTAGQRQANIRATEKLVGIQQLEIERLEEQTRLEVAENYYDLQRSGEALRIRQQAVINAQRSLRDAQALEQAGVGTRFAVLQSQVQLAQEQQRLVDAIAQLRTDRRTLASQLNLPQDADIYAADPVQPAGGWELPLPSSIILAYENRAELEQQLLLREQRQQQRIAELAANQPQISVFAQYNVLKTTADDPLITQGSGDGYVLGARVNWNLFDGGQARARADQRLADQAIAETDFTNNRNQVRLQVEQAYFELTSNYENIQTAETAVNEARESLRLARLRFQAGVGTQTEVINAETDLTEAEFNRIQAILGYNRALARLQRSVSNLPPRAGVTP